jgi:hypothetical protein
MREFFLRAIISSPVLNFWALIALFEELFDRKSVLNKSMKAVIKLKFDFQPHSEAE